MITHNRERRYMNNKLLSIVTLLKGKGLNCIVGKIIIHSLGL